jgi:hypothetical protein
MEASPSFQRLFTSKSFVAASGIKFEFFMSSRILHATTQEQRSHIYNKLGSILCTCKHLVPHHLTVSARFNISLWCKVIHQSRKCPSIWEYPTQNHLFKHINGIRISLALDQCL